MEGIGVGRIVHYVAPAAREGAESPEHAAALIVGTGDEDDTAVNLQVFWNRAAHEFKEGVRFSPLAEPNTWHWPERS